MSVNTSGASAHITPFNFNTHAVRVIDRDGSPWFVAFDVCSALGYSNPSDAVATHLDDDERMTIANSESHSGQRGGSRLMTIISESGLYALVLRSRKPAARQFAKWVTSEVLPAIRKTGSYQPVSTSRAAAVAPVAANTSTTLQLMLVTTANGCSTVEVLPAAALPKLILHSDTFTGREVYDIACHANLRMMEETTRIGTVSDLEQLRKTVRSLPSHELTTLTRDAWMELSFRTVNGGSV